MSMRAHPPGSGRRDGAQGGFTLVELMVTVAIAMFLLFGLVTIVQNIRQTWFNQQALAQLQDQQRFAMTVLTDIIQQSGYFPDPTTWTLNSALPVAAPYGAGQPLWGQHTNAATPDEIGVRFRTALGDKIINCTGGSNVALGPNHAYTNLFSVVGGQLVCSLDGAAVPVTLVSGIANLQILYGVNRSNPTNSFDTDTYLTADQMDALNGLGANGNGDWDNVTSVMITLTFNNPLVGQAGQPATIAFQRVVTVMGRGGVHT